jgi:hypothetical protein
LGLGTWNLGKVDTLARRRKAAGGKRNNQSNKSN